MKLAPLVIAAALIAVAATEVRAGDDIVLYTSDVSVVAGNWARTASASAAGTMKMSSTDAGWSQLNAPLAAPNDYFEAAFTTPANVAYHVWLRLRATNDSKYNDSVWVQFSDARDAAQNPLYLIGSTSGLAVNLENCYGCGVSGWGWQDKAYWLQETAVVQFASSGTHRVRVQTREDGVTIDQIVLSPVTYMSAPPGPLTNDATILPESSTSAPSSGSNGGGTGPYGGSPVALPRRIQAENFDNGGQGVSYHDTTTGNTGGAYRSTDVDLEPASGGGYDVGWVAAGEWLNYTVNVPAAGSYVVQVRVASPNGGAMHVGFNTASNVWVPVAVPATGGWQNWTTVSFQATLGAGTQQMTVLFDSAGLNLDYVDVTTASGGGTATRVPVIDWNIQINDGSEAHARLVMDLLAQTSPQPQVIVIEEGYLQHFNAYLDELQRQTGKSWHGAFATACTPGNWNGTSCTSTSYEGVGIFTTYDIVSTSSTFFPYADCWTSARVGLRAAINVNGVITQVFATHLQTGGCANDAQSRFNSMSNLKAWASGFAAPQLAAGDFNATPDQVDTTSGMLPNFVDSWPAAGTGWNVTAYGPNPTVKIDYWFADPGGRASPVSSQVIYSTGSVSDHHPIQAVFTIK